jgi:hypothetical protein
MIGDSKTVVIVDECNSPVGLSGGLISSQVFVPCG